MDMKTTMIELLNKLSKGEIPKKIKFCSYIYEYDEEEKDFCYEENESCWLWLFRDFLNNTKYLNEDIEIIEETEEIDIDIRELLEMYEPDSWQAKDGDIVSIVENVNEISRTVNQLIKAVKQINNKLKEPKLSNTEEEILNNHIPRID